MAWDTSMVPEAAKAAVRVLEGLRLEPYDDGRGFMTIGYGARRDPSGAPVTKATAPITEAQAEILLNRDLGHAIKDVRSGVMIPIAECQAAGLTMLAFNLGELRLQAPTLLRAVNASRPAEAAKAFGLYINSGGKPMLGLRRRRWMEAAIYLGTDPLEAKKTAWAKIATVTDWPPLPEPQKA